MREIKFRAWDKERKAMYVAMTSMNFDGRLWSCSFIGGCGDEKTVPIEKLEIMQFTGLRDKNGLTEIYEGDIIDENGLVKGNVYESPQVFREGIDCVVKGMGTAEWRGAESIAMGRGCNYTK